MVALGRVAVPLISPLMPVPQFSSRLLSEKISSVCNFAVNLLTGGQLD